MLSKMPKVVTKFRKNFVGIFWVPFSSEMDKSILVEVGNDGDGSPMYIARYFFLEIIKFL